MHVSRMGEQLRTIYLKFIPFFEGKFFAAAAHSLRLHNSPMNSPQALYLSCLTKEDERVVLRMQFMTVNEKYMQMDCDEER